MKRSWMILMAGMLVAAAAYGAFYFALPATYCSNPAGQPAELSWLRQEFKLNPQQYKKVAALYADYLPQCRAMCRRIDQINERLKVLLTKSDHVTPKIKAALEQAARIRAACQANMLNHFYAVSRAMPPAEGKRYLAWMQEQTLLPTYHHPLERAHQLRQ